MAAQKELRLALVMNGGVSLAVWIGGAAHEFLRFVSAPKSGKQSYRPLIELGRFHPVIDVISGTSAGGINGAVLAHALVTGQSSLESMRSLWVNDADFAKLLRPATAKDPASLLKGKASIEAMIRKAFSKDWTAPSDPQPLDLIMTGTLVHGRTRRLPDAFNSDVIDTDHGILFRFNSGSWRATAGSDPSIVDRLVTASQVSSAFPAAFEPVWLVKDELENVVLPRYVPPSTKGAWAFDGGVILNKPIRPALEAIFKRSTSGPVRRLLAYVVPDPGASDRRGGGPDTTFADVDGTEVPKLAQTGWAALSTLPRNQSVGAEIAEIQDHNSQARTYRDFRTQLAATARYGLVPLARSFEPAYREVARAGSAERSAERMIRYLSDRGDLGALRKLHRPGRIQRELYRARLSHIPDPFLPDGPVSRYGETERDGDRDVAFWGYGIQHAQHIAHTVIDYAQQILEVLPPLPQHDAVRNIAVKVKTNCEDALNLMTESAKPDIEGWWQPFVEELLKPETDVAAWADEFYDSWNGEDKRGPHQGIGDQAARCAKELVDLRDALEGLTPQGIARNDETRLKGIKAALDGLTLSPASKAEEMLDILRSMLRGGLVEGFLRVASEDDLLSELFADLAGDDAGTSRDWPHGRRTEWTLRQLLALELIHTATGAPDVQPQEIEFMQISGFTDDAVSKGSAGRSPAGKLTGVQLGHFGAFYKKAWRANDWMWGRLDAAARIVDMVLLHRELHQAWVAHRSQPERLKAAVDAAITESPINYIANFMESELDRMRAEVNAECSSILNEPDPADHEALDTIRTLVKRRLQLEILSEELARVDSAITEDSTAGHSTSPKEAAFQKSMAGVSASGLEPVERVERVRQAFADSNLAADKITDAIASDRFTAIASQAGLVASAAAKGSFAKNKYVSAILSPARGALWIIYTLVQTLVRDRRSTTARTAYVLAFAIAGGLLAAAFISQTPGALVSGLAAVLLIAVAVLTVRPGQRWWRHVAVLVGGLVSVLVVWHADSVGNWFTSMEITGDLSASSAWVQGHRVTLAIIIGVLTLAVIGTMSAPRSRASSE